MKNWMIVMSGFVFIPAHAKAQDWQGVLMLDSRSGYTSNTYLNPYLSEWDRSSGTGYIMTAPIGQWFYYTENTYAETSAGAIYSPFFDDRDNWGGVFSTALFRVNVSNSLSAGIEGGASRFSTSFSRELYWIQPAVTWSPGMFTQLRLKAGSAFRKLDNEEFEEQQGFFRFDTYAIEFETWSGFRWRFHSQLYGSLDDITGNTGLRSNAEYHHTRNVQFSVRTGLERYQYLMMTENGGFPIGGPGQPNGVEFSEETDKIFRLGVGSRYRVNQRVAFTVNADYLNYFSSVSDETLSDMHLSAGVQLTLLNRNSRSRGATAEWKLNDTQLVALRIQYSGDGQLYILGDFNDWEQPGIPLRKQSRNRFVADLALDPGAYEYKILLIDDDGESWIDFSDDTFTVSDGFGGENGLIIID